MNRFSHNLTTLPLAVAVALAAMGTAYADTLIVTSTDGYGPGTLRDAIDFAHDGDTIVFDPSLDGGTIDLSTNCPYSPGPESLYIYQDLTIVGPGINNLTIKARYPLRIFSVDASAQVTVSGLTIQNGHSTFSVDMGSGTLDGFGGAILNFGDLTLSDCVVSGSYTWGYDGGGIANYGTMTIENCGIVDNHAYRDGGGIYNAGAMALSQSTVTGNSAWYGGGIFNDTTGMLLLVNSDVSRNQSGQGNNNIYNLGKLKKQKK